MAQFVGSRMMFVLIGGWLITGGVIPSVAAKNDPCRVGCNTEKQACRDEYQGAFQTTKSDCTGSGKAKRKCVKTARTVLRAGVKKCRGFAATCLACCKAGGTNCNVQCGDGVVSGDESCDPPGSSGCAGGGACNESCRCPSVVTTTSLATATTSAPSTTTTTSTSSTSTSTIPPPCGNGVKDGDETAVDCGGGTCAPCADGLACTKGGDCRSRFCSGENVCTDPCPTQPAGTPCDDDDNSCTVDSCDGSTCQHTPVDDGVVCRRAAGPCDAAEVCDGSGDPCPPDQLLSDGEVCRPRQGGCDEEEECNGSSPECPPDKLTQAGFTCRLARGVCDVAETCSGTDAACPPDGILGPETVCRSVYGVCDVAETCNGSSKDCPEDGFQIGTVCRSSAGVCDLAETCVGDPDCPLDGFLPASTVCRTSAGGCDPAEMCTGSGAACPANAFLPSGAVCRSSAGVCDVTEVCDGSHASCPQNLVRSRTTICRPSAGPCDIADHCDGVDCESDLKEKSDVICRSQAGVCDVADYCDGTSSACPDAVVPSATVCRSANGVCDVAETCDGVKRDCPANGFKANGTSCGDSGTACRNQDTCSGTSATCTDNGFKPATTQCTGAANGGLCDDNDHCDGSGACVDAFRPSTFACVFPRDASGNNYACTEVAYCTGASSTCPAPVTGSFDPTIPCRDTAPGRDAICDPPLYCTDYGVCPNDTRNDATCDGGLKAGQWCDILNSDPNQCGVGYHCVATVCPRATLPCEKPWTCTPSLVCASNGFLPVGTDCFGDYACEKYSCDATGNCVDQNVTRTAGASCRAPANECDVREFCGDPSTVPSNGRYDFTGYPNCGPDLKKTWNSPCTYDFFGQDAPGKCIGGECNPFYCKNSIECPDGWVCGCPPGQLCAQSYCIPATTAGGYGDVCTATGYCSRDPLSWDPGRQCTRDTDCRDQTHTAGVCLKSSCDGNSAFPGDGCASDTICKANGHGAGKCVAATRGDCGSIPGRTFDYVCCSGMKGDGQGNYPPLGETGRCQECCGSGGLLDQNCTDQDDPNGTTSFQCCDGECTDVVSDIYNCTGCNYDTPGYDCTDRITACNPSVVECDGLTVGGGCVFEDYCEATVDANGWVAAGCEIPDEQVPASGCDYCTGVFTTTPDKPCLTEEDCGGFTGITNSCYHDASFLCGVSRTQARSTVPECTTAPYTDCSPICYEVGNSPNVGDACGSDTDCRGGTKCKTSCRFSENVYFAICFEGPTCQW